MHITNHKKQQCQTTIVDNALSEVNINQSTKNKCVSLCFGFYLYLATLTACFMRATNKNISVDVPLLYI